MRYDRSPAWATCRGGISKKGTIMKSYKMTLLAMMAAFGLACLTTGCDRTVSNSESEKVKSDGTVEKKEKTVTEQPDGTIKKEEKKSTDKPNP
jgi:hypothetical protein